MYSQRVERLETVKNFAKLDLDRRERSGIPEVIYAEGKSCIQLVEIVSRLYCDSRVVVSRLSQEQLDALSSIRDICVESSVDGQIAVVFRQGVDRVAPCNGRVGLLAAGTSDVPIAEQARVMAQEMGCHVLHFYDVGVAAMHRLVDPLHALLDADVSVVIVVAGMEGALPTVVKGLVPVPVIGVPTSIGYGTGRDGLAALLTMLNSCSPGLTVVNIDNGIGAGATAGLISTRLAEAQRRSSDNVFAS